MKVLSFLSKDSKNKSKIRLFLIDPLCRVSIFLIYLQFLFACLVLLILSIYEG